jgi:serine phosphatase RsbU (regulator of sigma subunit)
MRPEFENAGRVLERLANRIEEEIRRSTTPPGSAAKGPRALDAVYWNLRDLLGEGATRAGLKDLDRDARDTFRFFTRQIDFEALSRRPWWQRYPLLCWHTFVETAARLTPPRRLAFAIGIFTFLLGWIPLLFDPGLQDRGAVLWILVSSGIFFLLLLIELRDKLSLKGDLEIAREIQFGLVPAHPVRAGSLQIDAHMRPANTVGGDYYDVIDLGENRFALIVGDVAGKGMPAALLMALLQGSLRTLIAAGFRGPELVSKLNVYLCANTPSNKLVTLFYSEVDTRTGEFQYINAGHNAPYFLRADKTFQRLDATSTVLGIAPDCTFECRTASLAPSDRLVLFTDGVTEAFDQAENEYGEERLTALLLARIELPPEKLIQTIIRSVVDFCGTTRPGDDITIMVVQRDAAISD